MTSSTLATPITESDHTQGQANAAITLVQYGDYECPYTRLSRHSVHQLQREFSDSLRFVFRHFPLEEIHPTSTCSSTRKRSRTQTSDATRWSSAWTPIASLATGPHDKLK